MLHELAELVLEKAKADRQFATVLDAFESRAHESSDDIDILFRMTTTKAGQVALTRKIRANVALDTWINQQTEADLDAMVRVAKKAGAK